MLEESTLKMMKGFMEDHNNGLTISDIADKYQVSKWTVYYRLSEIAEKANVSRDSLLEKVNAPHVIVNVNTSIAEPVNVTTFDSEMANILKKIDQMIAEIDAIITKEESVLCQK